jgi:hypothetical protein
MKRIKRKRKKNYKKPKLSVISLKIDNLIAASSGGCGCCGGGRVY